MVYHKEDQTDVAIAANAAAELKEFTSLAQSMLSVDWSAAPPAIRAAVVDLRATNDAVQRALDVLVAQATHFAPASNRTAAALPGDVLHEIFRTWLSLDGDHRSSRIPSAFTAASVNKHWRSVALQSGSLWATLIINFDHTNDLNEHIDNVLERSQGYPLDLTILKAPLTCWYFELEPSADHIARLLSASRTIRCSFSSSSESSYDFDQSVLAMFQTELPLAETIICSNYHPGCVLPMGVQLFTLSPKLRRLEMGYIPLDAVDWSLVPHITTFATQCSVTEEQLRIICTSCPRLTDLSLGSIDTPLSGVAAHSLAYLERLRCDGRQALQYFGHHTSVPVLQTLEIPCSAQTLLHLSTFVRDTPWTSLRVLELHYIWNSDAPPEFLHAMRNMPNLVELRLTHETDCLTKFFERWQTAEWVEVAPKLRALVLRQCSFPTSATRALAAFLLARKRANAMVRRLEIVQAGIVPYETDIYSKWMTPRLRQLVEEVFIDTDTAELDDPE